MHGFMAAVLFWMTGPDSLDGNAEAQPPNGKPAQVEQTIGGGEGHAVVGTYGLRQAAFFKQALKSGKSSLFLDGLHSLAEQKVTAGVIGNGEGVAIPLIPEHELALVVRAPQSRSFPPQGDDHSLRAGRKLVGVAIGSSRPVR